MTESVKRSQVLYTVYFTVLIDNIKKHGLCWAVKKIFFRALKEFSWITLLPISITMHLLGFRRLIIRIEHIGHLATEFDTFLKAQQLGLSPRKRYFAIAHQKKSANVHLLSYWKNHIPIITHPVYCTFLELLTKRFFMRDNPSLYAVKFFGAQPIYHINRLWDKKPPLLTLCNEDEIWGKITLNKIGIPNHQWFVCVHVREGGFLPHNELIQSHRNASIAHTIPAIQEIIRRGGMVVRMGDASMTPLPRLQGVIDYAHHPLKSDRMDVILCAKAACFLGCTSGLAFLSMIFGVPVAHANMIPVETLGIRHQDLSIPKLLWDESRQSYLGFKEIMSSEIGGFFFSHEYKNAHLLAKENTPEEILDLIIEMLDRLEGKFVESSEDQQLHTQYMGLFKSTHYSYHATSRICIAFLKRHQDLLS